MAIPTVPAHPGPDTLRRGSPPGRFLPGGRLRPDFTLLSAAAFSGLAAAAFLAMVGLLVADSWPVWVHAGWGYLGGTTWFYRGQSFGILPMIYGTAAVAAVALVLAGTVGVGAAVWIAEILSPRARFAAKVAVEILAGVPSVVYGILGMVLLRPRVYDLLEDFGAWSGDTLLTGGLLLAVMILPTVVTLADDALRGVPGAWRQAGRALGLTRAESILHLSLPQALPGLAAALLLALGRALGETIAVFLVIGRMDNQWPEHLLSLEPLLSPGQTLTTKLGGSETFLAYGDPLHWGAIVGLALVLLAGVSAVTVAGVTVARLGGRRG